MSKLTDLFNQFSKPSTYAGLSSLALVAGISDTKFQAYALAVSGVFGFLAIVLKEVSE